MSADQALVGARFGSAPAWPWLRWFALAWLALYLPVFYDAYGAWHFLFLCHVGVLLSVLGLWTGNQLLLSSQAVATPVLALVWLADAATRLATGEFLHGGTAYLWSTSIPAAARALSLFHVGLPLLLAWCMHRRGYDRRGFVLQCLVATGVIALSLWLAPAQADLNYIHGANFGGLSRSPLEQAAALWLFMVLAIYLPAHLGWRALQAAGFVPRSTARVAPGPGR